MVAHWWTKWHTTIPATTSCRAEAVVAMSSGGSRLKGWPGRGRRAGRRAETRLAQDYDHPDRPLPALDGQVLAAEDAAPADGDVPFVDWKQLELLLPHGLALPNDRWTTPTAAGTIEDDFASQYQEEAMGL